MQTNAPPASTRAARIETVLRAAFAPLELQVVDDSARHVGHAGHDPAGETHYQVLLVSPVFRGRNRVERARAVHEALAAELAAGLHAVNLTLRTPEEHQLLVD